MQPFYAIYNKGTTLQFAFNDHTLHPRYIGVEFPIGQSLSAAINLKEDELNIFFNNLIDTYIEYLDANNANEFYEKFERALFDIDEYCIYLREIVHNLLAMIKELHPHYQLSHLTYFIENFTQEEMLQLTNVISRINENALEQTEYKSYFWNLCIKFMLDKFSNDIRYLKADIYDLCNISDDYTGISRLNSLDNRRKLFYANMISKTGRGTSIGEAENSKIFSTSSSENDEILNCVYVDKIIEALYYEFLTVLENNLPIKLCKNCNLPFIPKGRIDSLYCDRVVPGTKDKCSAVGAHNAYKNNLSDIEAEFYAARRRYNTRVSRSHLLKAEFEVWKIKAKEKLTAYRNGEISADEFKKWFMDDEWTRI